MAYGQIVESFESGNLNNWVQSTEGRWKADTVSSLSGSYSIHHTFDNPDAGTDQAGIPAGNLHPSHGLARWSFLVRHGYDPSSSNNWAVFLMSDSEPHAMSPNSTNGFAIGVNLAGTDDTLRLWKMKNNVVTTLINCRINWQTDVGITDAVKLLIERSKEGSWSVSAYRLNGMLIRTISGFDSELFTLAWFGIYYKYSSTKDRLLWLDDINIEGVFYEDTVAPGVTAVEPSGLNSLRLIFSEEPSGENMVPANFSLNNQDNLTVSVDRGNAITYKISFAGTFVNKSLNNLLISELCDKTGNCTENIAVPFTTVWAERGDVIISEIMADPLPEVSLPGKEYLELTNLTEYSFNLKNWNLTSEDQTWYFPEISIRPSEILIICAAEDTSLFTKYGRVAGLNTFPLLTDAGRLICLNDSSGNLIHGVEYSSDWYDNELKSAGGWSLEITDTQFPFFDEGNWTASESRKGGTPGSVNSVSQSNPDNGFYGIQNVFPDDSISLNIRFSEPVFDLQRNAGLVNPGGRRIEELYATDKLFREFRIILSYPLTKGELYQFDIFGDVKDFAGNRIDEGSYKFGLTETTVSGDILFNELLFNPLPGDPDYIELCNSSDKVIDASRLLMISLNSESGDTSQTYTVSGEKRCIIPGSYYAITSDRKRISDRYFSANPEFIFETGSLPSMSDDKGHLILLNRELDRIDEVVYNEDMHYSLLSGFEGVSLEKIGPRYKSEDKYNWHSAAESAGWGTPGALNSVFSELPAVSDKVVFSSSKISPDNDGNEDFLVIGFNLAGNGNVVSVTVFDETGNYVKEIVENMLAGPEASVIWDGTADDGSPVRTGIYIVFITMYDDTGKTIKWKKVCTVIRK